MIRRSRRGLRGTRFFRGLRGMILCQGVGADVRCCRQNARVPERVQSIPPAKKVFNAVPCDAGAGDAGFSALIRGRGSSSGSREPDYAVS